MTHRPVLDTLTAQAGAVKRGLNEKVLAALPPARVLYLPVSPAGFPIPWFVAWFDEAGQRASRWDEGAKPDFRVVDQEKFYEAVRKKLCWICGQPLGRRFCFVVGPMCAVSLTSSEPPCHVECGDFSARACPFLTQPRMRRNLSDLPVNTPAPGFGIDRNPGVVAVWKTESYRPFRPVQGSHGYLIEMGKPLEVRWFAQGRAAIRAEVEESLRSGMPLLDKECDREATSADRTAARNELGRRLEHVRATLPDPSDPREL